MAVEQADKLFAMERLGVLMQANVEDANEAWGVLNPGACRNRSNELILFPRVVAHGNLSRIGVARVILDAGGNPCGVERLKYALEPRESFERGPDCAGCEDPRVTYVQELDIFLMAYTAYGPSGPRVALAASDDLLEWRRLGPIRFGHERGVDFDACDNKDALIFPELVLDPRGNPALALIHRPTFGPSPRAATNRQILPNGVLESRPSMWISYCSVERLGSGVGEPTCFSQHRLLAVPREPWESLKIGGGTPPVRTEHGWLIVFHGVSGSIREGTDHQSDVHYAAGVLLLDGHDPARTVYRSARPILEPLVRDERLGIVPNVVFPTGADVRDDGRLDVYYGMADSRIGLARLSIPRQLPVRSDASLAA